ncbi:hypothetical protein N7520_006283 [Penicillium odoratum]|uniref:uncharacterized protein n=1 Tax=Penicillium odoratum TaxID=1167516 RepID=UPI0025499977|nr:uncharacterized protein N7520_006283 [Penicillium odoratum]KAJ5759127.1 hypothetical protein N7520_006283 [Penicillium odoratum]
MRVMNAITDKPEWDRKILNEEIVSKWREEISTSGEDISPAMIDYIFEELQAKAEFLKDEGFVTVFDMGVVKSDTAIPEDLRKALADAVAPLENVSDDQKDYHPGSDQKVLDLVHPSLFPLVYGHSRILRDETIGLEDCLGTTGQGEILPIPSMIEQGRASRFVARRYFDEVLYSHKFQWLPCDVGLNVTEAEHECRITSYINNLHPVRHRDLYAIVEKFIARAIPLWNRSLTGERYNSRRIIFDQVEYEEPSDPPPEQWPDEDDEAFYQRFDAYEENQVIKKPEPGQFQRDKLAVQNEINIHEQFGKTGLQVIVKLANIELSPESPKYNGGSWHIEGQLNERICATAIYYYDSENITESPLAFRQRANADYIAEGVRYPQSRHEFLQQIYGFEHEVTGNDNNCQITQDLGEVSCRQGRLLTFPNVLQHRVTPFSLADPSKPGHRKILALFLVDPHLRIISTANVPPQQEDWGKEKHDLTHEVLSGRLPAELKDMVCEEGVLQPLMSMEEAKGLRLELMKERSVKSVEQNEVFERGSFSLCEH